MRLALSSDDRLMIKAPTLDEMVEGIRRGVANAVRDAHARGLPYFEADDLAIYAVYPDGKRVVVEQLPTSRSKRSTPEPYHT